MPEATRDQHNSLSSLTLPIATYKVHSYIRSISMYVTKDRLDEQAKVTAMASQGVVTYMLPVEVFVTGIEVFDLQKVCLID